MASLRGGVLTLSGKVPSKEVGDEIATKAAAILGPDNVINNYEIDPTIPLVKSGPLVVEDVVLFATGSAQINPAFVPLLDLGTILLQTFPNVTITITAHTDAVGSAESNMALSERRAEAVANYWIERGIAPDRLILDPRGEEDLAIQTDQAQPENRRVQFLISGLID
jgi:outer membrane protein OmpA-like peptidoglycan-associated protein